MIDGSRILVSDGHIPGDLCAPARSVQGALATFSNDQRSPNEQGRLVTGSCIEIEGSPRKALCADGRAAVDGQASGATECIGAAALQLIADRQTVCCERRAAGLGHRTRSLIPDDRIAGHSGRAAIVERKGAGAGPADGQGAGAEGAARLDRGVALAGVAQRHRCRRQRRRPDRQGAGAAARADGERSRRDVARLGDGRAAAGTGARRVDAGRGVLVRDDRRRRRSSAATS